MAINRGVFFSINTVWFNKDNLVIIDKFIKPTYCGKPGEKYMFKIFSLNTDKNWTAIRNDKRICNSHPGLEG
jgi:hypothetical protein